MSATVRVTLIATGAEAVTISLVRTDGVLVSEHTLRPGETHNVAISDGQRIAMIEPAHNFANQLAQYRASLPHREPEPTEAEILAAIDALGAGSKPTTHGAAP